MRTVTVVRAGKDVQRRKRDGGDGRKRMGSVEEEGIRAETRRDGCHLKGLKVGGAEGEKESGKEDSNSRTGRPFKPGKGSSQRKTRNAWSCQKANGRVKPSGEKSELEPRKE